MTGIPSSPGIGAGTVFILHEREVPLGRTGPNAPADSAGSAVHVRRSAESELERFQRGVRVAAAYYEVLIDRVRTRVGDEEAEIFEGHLEIITGDDLAEAVEDAIMNNEAIAERAVVDFAEETAREFEELESDYFRQRAGDIRDIGRRVAEAIYYGSITDPGALPEQCVVVAEELTPSATARLETDRVVAIATEKGGRTSHAAILARSLAIPCVTGVEGLLAQVRSSQMVLVDGDAGTVDTSVTETQLAAVRARRSEEQDLLRRRREWSGRTPAALTDGTEVHLAANVSGADEARAAADLGARGVGLLRSEFVFMRYSDFPGVEQQAAEYRAVCDAVAPEPVIVRLLDCGADKPLPYARQAAEDNPFLGERGIRFLMAREEQLRNQIRAIARVGADGRAIRAMIPMVISPREIDAVRELFAAEGSSVPVGIMVETPASVLAAEELVGRADFVSIGTNDLVQYVLAVDRGNARVATLYEELHPAVITAIDRTVSAAHAAGIPVGVCGDMASHPGTALALLALGVDEISATVSAVPDIKAALSAVGPAELAELGTALRHGGGTASEHRARLDALIPTGAPPWA